MIVFLLVSTTGSLSVQLHDRYNVPSISDIAIATRTAFRPAKSNGKLSDNLFHVIKGVLRGLVERQL